MIHVIGGGVAGLSAAVALAGNGHAVTLHEASKVLGGRCRSFIDAKLGATIDTGTHLVLGANRVTRAFLQSIGGTFVWARPLFPIINSVNRELTILGPGRAPAGWFESAKAMGLPWCGDTQTVAERLSGHAAYDRLWQPLCVSALNTLPEQASAALFARLLRAILVGGAATMRPMLFPAGLSAAFADPAENFLKARGATILRCRRLTGLDRDGLRFGGDEIALAATDRVILALPPEAARPLLPALPDLPGQTIANLHFRVDGLPALPGNQPFLAVTGGTVQWLSLRGNVLSATISACQQRPDPTLVWAEIAGLCRLPSRLPAWRMIIERRATLAHTPETIRRRPQPRQNQPNLILAGDWLASPWPCTIEAAVTSGLAAARLAVERDDLSFPC